MRSFAEEAEGLEDVVAVGHDLGSMCREDISIATRESRHLSGYRIELLLEEEGEIAFDHVAQEDGGHGETSEFLIDRMVLPDYRPDRSSCHAGQSMKTSVSIPLPSGVY
jgi:hypothetical protein